MTDISDRLHRNVMVNTDYDEDHPDDVYFEMVGDNTHVNFATQVYLYNWMISSGIRFEVIRYHNDEIRAVVKNEEDRVKLRLAFQLIKDRPMDDYVGGDGGLFIAI